MWVQKNGLELIGKPIFKDKVKYHAIYVFYDNMNLVNRNYLRYLLLRVYIETSTVADTELCQILYTEGEVIVVLIVLGLGKLSEY